MTKKYTNVEFLEVLFKKVGKDIIPIEEYTDTKTKILVRHIECGNEWKITPNKLLMGRGCTKCSRKLLSEKQRLTLETLSERVSIVTNGIISLTGGEYLNNRTKMIFHCNVCGSEFTQAVLNFLIARKCPVCIKKKIENPLNKSFTKDLNNRRKSFYIKLKETWGKEYSVMGEYISANIKLLIKHNICGKEWLITPGNLLGGYGCPTCAIKRRTKKITKTTDDFSRDISEIDDGNFVLVGEYKGIKNKVIIYHKKCDETFEIIAGNFIKRKTCINCKIKSVGENKIKNYLKKHLIDFSQQKTFSNCRGMKGGKAKFDFSIYYNNKIFCLIEYNGIQHYKIVDFFGGSDEYIYRKINDSYKKYYCRKNNIPLVEISYLNYNKIEEILEIELGSILEGR